MVEWIAAGVALLAAAAAFWQAGEARAARRQAQSSAADAATSWTRIAEVMETQEERAAAEAARYELPMSVSVRNGRSLREWTLELGGDEVIADLEWILPENPEPGTVWLTPINAPLPSELHPGQTVAFRCLMAGGLPHQFEVVLRFRRMSEDETRERRFTLRRL